MNYPIGALAIGLGCSMALAGPGVDTMSDQELRDMVFELKSEVDSLRSEQDTTWLTEQRAEQVRGLVADVLADADTRAALQGSGMTSGYDKGFFLSSSDGNWLMKINYQLQVRWLYNDASDQSSSHGFEIRRSKLKFKGHIVDPSWGYALTIASNRSDVQFGSNLHSANLNLGNAYINKKLDNDMYIRVGQFKAPFLREELVSSTRQLAVDRSIINNAFTWTFSQGAMLGWSNDNLKIEAMYNEGPNNVNTQASTLNGKQGITARVEYLLGEGSDWGMFGGLNARNTNGKSGFMLGAALGWFNGGSTQVQEYGNGDVARSLAWTVDGTYMGDRWTVFSYIAWAEGKNRYNRSRNNTTGFNGPTGRTGQNSWGWVIQGGFLIQDDLELFSRYEMGHIKHGVSEGGLPNDDLIAMTIGGNWFINNNLKLTMDWGYSFNPVTDDGNAPTSADYTSSGTGWRADTLDNEGQWLLRAQLQLLF